MNEGEEGLAVRRYRERAFQVEGMANDKIL
jgi:hypothetical protein